MVFVRLTGFFWMSFPSIGKEKKDLGCSRPKTIRNGQLCFEWDNSNMYQSSGAPCPNMDPYASRTTIIHIPFVRVNILCFNCFVGSLFVVTSDLKIQQ
jgi:hypothetical protein